MTRFSYSLAPLALLALAGCASHDPASVDASSGGSPPVAVNDAENLLKKSMDMYKGLHSFRTQYSWKETIGSQSVTAKRTFTYEAPNLYKAVTNASDGKKTVVLTSTSDGRKVLETSSNEAKKAQSSPAPATLAASSSMVMQYPIAGGTLLYKFFGGSGAYEDLVDTSKGPPGFGEEVKEPTETARDVKFYGTETYGHVNAFIGEKSFKVYAISYDSEPLMQRVRRPAGSPPPAAKADEQYREIELNPTIAKAQFVATVPKDVTIQEANAQGKVEPTPSAPVGAKAPVFQVTPLNGGAPVSLASLRGKPVLVDFWATWCGPCKASLPHTQAIYDDLKSKGLQVLVVSDEEAPTIKAFINRNKYTFPVYRDIGHQVESAYGVTGIPSVLIIDKEGKLQNYFVGLRDESTLRDALKKVGAG